MIIELIEHSRGTLRNVEYVGVGRSYEGFTCLQVRTGRRVRQRHIEVGRIRRIVARGRTLVPSSPIHHEPRAQEIKAFLQSLQTVTKAGARPAARSSPLSLPVYSAIA